jgi:hypothetical protein
MPASSQYPQLLMIIRHGEKPGDPTGPDLSIMGSARAAALPSLFTPNASDTSASVLPELTCDLTVGSRAQFAGAYGLTQVKAVAQRFQTPEFLFATSPHKTGKKTDDASDAPDASDVSDVSDASDASDAADDHSHRPIETITPLAQALQQYSHSSIAINDSFGNNKAGIQGIKQEILGKPDVYGGRIILICWHHGTIPALTEAFGVPSTQLPWSKWPSTIFDLVFCITWSSGQAQLEVDYQQLLFGDTAALASLTTV